MAAATPTFHPIPTLEVRAPARPAVLRRVRAVPAVGVVFGSLGLAALLGLGRTMPSGPTSDALAPVFMSFAVGDVTARLPVQTEPGGGETVALLPAGTRVGIGGRVSFGSLWASGVAYWVSADIDGHAVRGFVPAGGIEVREGNPPVLSFDAAAAPGSADDHATTGAFGFDRASSAAPDSVVGSRSDDAAAGAHRADERESAAQSAAVQITAAPAATDAVAIPWLPEPVRAWSDLLNAAAATHGVAADLLAIITLCESGGHPSARSHVGATGLMQVMPATAGDIARQRGMGAFDASRLTEPAVAIDFGAWYLAQQLKSFGQADDPDWSKSVTLAAAAYNGGPGTAMRYQRDGSLPSETRHYIDWVGGMWRERADATSPTYERWMAAGGSVLVGKAQAWLDAGGSR